MKVVFGDIVVVDDNQIGVVVKNWSASILGTEPPRCEVYVRSYNAVKEYRVADVERYQVRHKYLDEDELEYQHNAEMEP